MVAHITNCATYFFADRFGSRGLAIYSVLVLNVFGVDVPGVTKDWVTSILG